MKINLRLNYSWRESSVGGAHDNCYGSGGNRGMNGETPVTVKDGTGKILAIGKLGAGSRPQIGNDRYSTVICNFESTLEKLLITRLMKCKNKIGQYLYH
jgi:hypothetical protein